MVRVLYAYHSLSDDRRAFQSMVAHVGGPTLLYSMLIREFANYPRVGRYAMQPIACFREGRGSPGDTI